MGHPVFYLATVQMREREREGRNRGEKKEGHGVILLEDCGSTSNAGQGVPGSGWPRVDGAAPPDALICLISSTADQRLHSEQKGTCYPEAGAAPGA